jgi:beta-phosphoglucomutase-like phosphatase (HAD superfamily)
MPRPTLLLFDIDGTLISTDGAGRRAIERAFAACHGSDAACKAFSFGGMTDRAIARAGLRGLGLEPSEALIDSLLASYLGFLDAELAACRKFRVIAGIEAALTAGGARKHVALGLGTGNLRVGAQKKLEHAKLWHHFPFGGFADDSEDRPTLIRRAAERGAQRLGAPLERCRVVVVGDTPLDVGAARANGFEAFAVASGGVAFEELAALRAEHVFRTLADEGALARLLGEEAAAR